MKNVEIISIEEFRKLNKKKKNKYGAKKVEYRGKKFDSKLERDYFMILEQRVKERRIQGYELHKRVDLIVNGQLICYMKVDFVITNKDGSTSYHDTKGMITDVFKLKAKLFKALLNKEIKIITRENLFS